MNNNIMKGAFPKVINGDTVIGYTSSKNIKDLGWMDTASLSSWYQEDPDKNHLGLVELFSTMSSIRIPTYYNMFKRGAVINVNGADGKFTYDLPVVDDNGCYTLQDTSIGLEAAGIDESTFEIALDRPFTKGDILTYDMQFGEQVIVSEDHDVRKEGDAWFHTVQLVTQDKAATYPIEKLQKGIQYFKVGHALGEYSQSFSHVQAPENIMRTITCEFQLGNHRGVETFQTMYAGMKKFSGAAMHSQKFWDYFTAEQERLGTDKNGNSLDMFYVGKKGANGGIKKNSVLVGSAMEYLVLLECMKLEAHQLLFQKAATVRDVQGVKRLNEGIWHQIRRGRIIKYANYITRSHIQSAAAYLFRNRPDMQVFDRKLKFKVGQMALRDFLNIFREEFNLQTQTMNLLLGTDRQLPMNPVHGELNDLKLKPVIITEVPIPDIGVVTVEHDPTLDYLPLTERFSAGFYSQGFAWTTYSAVIWDAGSAEYSNAFSNLPAGTTIQNAGAAKDNIFYVKPDGSHMFWGYSNGRWNPDNARGIMSSMRQMGREFFCHSISAGWVKDISRYIVIEKQRN
jgi:hypothetical protein